MKIYLSVLFLALLAFFSWDADFAFAQARRSPKSVVKAPVAAVATPNAGAAQKYLGGLSELSYNQFFEGSFLFSSVERALIQKAVKGKVDEPEKNLAQEQKQKEILRPEDFIGQKEAAPTIIERNFEVKEGEQKIVKPVIPERRLIVLSGILYRAKNNWTVWINGQKVTPDNYLPEIIEIKVENSSYVSLKWYDIGLQEVISITLRPNQVYDITTGILLPG